MALFACSPRVQDHLPATQTALISADSVTMSDGVALPLRSWVPADKPKAVVLALHGFNDYSKAFESPGKYLSKQGVAVFAYDQRGFGASKEHGIWGGEANLTRDVHEMVALLKARYPDVPLYLLGESMGGAVVIASYSKTAISGVDGIVLSAPAVWGSETLNGFYRMTLWLMAHTFPSTEFTGKGLNIMASDNIEMLRAMGRDPLIIKSTRADAIYGIVELMDSAYKNIANVKEVPVLFLYGARDQVIPPDPIRRTIDRLSTRHHVVYYPAGYHMLLRDLRAQVVLEDVAHWLKNPDDPVLSGFDKDWQERIKQHVLTPVVKTPKPVNKRSSRKRR